MASTISAGTTAGSAIVVSGDTSGSLALQTNGTTTAVTINTSQNVGIGVTPATRLDVGGTGLDRLLINPQFAGSGVSLTAVNAANNAYSPYTTNGTVSIFQTGGTERMRIDSSGNVGMGTAANGLGIKLEVRSSNQITDARGMVAINSTNTAATNLGGSISFGGENGQAATPYNFGSIAGRYEGSGYLGYLQFSTTGAGGVVAEQMRIDSAGLLKFNSGYGSAATAYGCRAWVNFNGTGTVAIRASGNVSSITDNGTGDYTVNFTTAMPDVNYVATFGPVTRAGADSNCMIRYSNGMGTYTLTTTTYRFGAGDIAGALVAQDPVSVLVAFHR